MPKRALKGPAAKPSTRSLPSRVSTHAPREVRYENLRRRLGAAQRELEDQLGSAADDDERGEALREFWQDLVRVTRADSRLLAHPIAQRWICLARGWGWRWLLRAMHRGLEKGVRRPFTTRELSLLDVVDRLRWPPEGAATTFRRAGEPKPLRSLRSIYYILLKKPETKDLLRAKRHGEVMSYAAFHRLIADGEAGGRLGRLRGA